MRAEGIHSDGSRRDITEEVVWASSNPGILAVANNPHMRGRLTAVAPGAAYVAAMLEGVEASLAVTVTSAQLLSIQITLPDHDPGVGESVPLSAVGHYSDGSSRDITAQAVWTSSNPGVAAIINLPKMAGLLNTYSAGRTTVSASLNGIHETALIEVTGAVLEKIQISVESLGLTVDSTLRFTVLGHYSDETVREITSQVTWISLDEAVAEAGNEAGGRGLITGKQPGEVHVVALIGRVGLVVKLTVLKPVVELEISPATVSLPKGAVQVFKATALFDDGTSQDVTSLASWKSSDDRVAVITPAGVITLEEGEASITVTIGGVTSAAAFLEVGPARPVLLQVTGEQLPGGEVQFTAKALFSDGRTGDLTTAVHWSASPAGILNISNEEGRQGRATILRSGTCTVEARYDQHLSRSISVTVN